MVLTRSAAKQAALRTPLSISRSPFGDVTNRILELSSATKETDVGNVKTAIRFDDEATESLGGEESLPKVRDESVMEPSQPVESIDPPVQHSRTELDPVCTEIPSEALELGAMADILLTLDNMAQTDPEQATIVCSNVIEPEVVTDAMEIEVVTDAMKTEVVNEAIDTIETEVVNEAIDTIETEVVGKAINAIETEVVTEAIDTIETEVVSEANNTIETEGVTEAIDTIETEGVTEASDTMETEVVIVTEAIDLIENKKPERQSTQIVLPEKENPVVQVGATSELHKDACAQQASMGTAESTANPTTPCRASPVATFEVVGEEAAAAWAGNHIRFDVLGQSRVKVVPCRRIFEEGGSVQAEEVDATRATTPPRQLRFSLGSDGNIVDQDEMQQTCEEMVTTDGEAPEALPPRWCGSHQRFRDSEDEEDDESSCSDGDASSGEDHLDRSDGDDDEEDDGNRSSGEETDDATLDLSADQLEHMHRSMNDMHISPAPAKPARRHAWRL